MYKKDKSKAVIPMGTFTRCIVEGGKQTVVSEKLPYTTSSRDSEQPITLVEGDIISYRVMGSFALHGGKTHELLNFHVISTAQKSLVITILLSGKLDFGYDDLVFQWDGSIQKSAVVVNLTKPASFHRKIYKDNNITKLNIVLPLSWIEERSNDNDNIKAFIVEHLAHFQLDLNAHLHHLTAQIIALSSPVNFIEKMQVEALTQLLLLEVFKQLSHYEQRSTELPECKNVETQQYQHPHFEHVLDQLILYIETNLQHNIAVDALAKLGAMSVSSLQRKFKNALGCSVQHYIRRRRLEIAKQQLERGIFSITEAAYTAGYRHPSNFTHAFKKTFGYPPQKTTTK
jgi:AraC-like DNA-binding protein